LGATGAADVFAAKDACAAGGGAFLAGGFFAGSFDWFFFFDFFRTGEVTDASCEGVVTRKMPGGFVPATEAGRTPAPVAGLVTFSGEPVLKVTLECDGEVIPRDGEETVSRFFPAMANSLSSVDCDDMTVHEYWL
jgi:hypothetical protein